MTAVAGFALWAILATSGTYLLFRTMILSPGFIPKAETPGQARAWPDLEDLGFIALGSFLEAATKDSPATTYDVYASPDARVVAVGGQAQPSRLLTVWPDGSYLVTACFNAPVFRLFRSARSGKATFRSAQDVPHGAEIHQAALAEIGAPRGFAMATQDWRGAHRCLTQGRATFRPILYRLAAVVLPVQILGLAALVWAFGSA